MFEEEVKDEDDSFVDYSDVGEPDGRAGPLSQTDKARIEAALSVLRCDSSGILAASYTLKRFFREDRDGTGYLILKAWIDTAPIIDPADVECRKKMLNGHSVNGYKFRDALPVEWAKNEVKKPVYSVDELVDALINDREICGKALSWTNDKPDGKSHLDIRIALQHLGVQLYKDVFDRRYYVDGPDGPTPLSDEAVRRLWLRVRELRLLPTKEFFWDVLLAIAAEDQRHPVLDHLHSLEKWDHTPRLENLFIKYLGAKNTALNHWMGKAVMVAMIRRLKQPGEKFDLMPVIEGPQGAGKSTFIRILGGDWYEDGLQLGADPKLVIEQTKGKWVIEVSELSGMSNRDIENVKAMISRTHDTAREAYERSSSTVPRSFVLWGTTNDKQYLKDPTGNRRFIPIEAGKILLEQLIEDREQLFAEALELEQAGESISMPPTLYREAAALQESRTITTTTYDRLAEVLGDSYGEIDIKTIRRILAEVEDRQEVLPPWDDRLKQQVGKAMAKLGFHKSRPRTKESGRETVYVKEGPNGERPEIEFQRPFVVMVSENVDGDGYHLVIDA